MVLHADAFLPIQHGAEVSNTFGDEANSQTYVERGINYSVFIMSPSSISNVVQFLPSHSESTWDLGWPEQFSTLLKSASDS